MKRYKALNEVKFMGKAFSDIAVWVGEIGNSSPKVIPKGATFKFEDEYEENGEKILVLNYKNKLYYTTEESYRLQQK